MKQRKIPMRTCVVSGEKCEKKDLEALKKINDSKIVIFEDKENDIEIAV